MKNKPYIIVKLFEYSPKKRVKCRYSIFDSKKGKVIDKEFKSKDAAKKYMKKLTKELL